MIETKLQLNQEILSSLGLDVRKITHHQKKIYQVLNGEISTEISIKDVCSIENSGVLSWKALSALIKNLHFYELFKENTEAERHAWIADFIVTCIPAAGAAARYWNNVPSDYRTAYGFPKALLPATLEGDTFLDIKLMEQKELMPTRSNAMIVPVGFQKKFQELTSSSEYPWCILEQTEKLSTIRFQMDGNPYYTKEKLYSPVPAGHGELLHLFKDILNRFPHTKAIHLRNIDNIIGTDPERVKELAMLAESFYLILSALTVVRKQVKEFVLNPKKSIEKNVIFASSIAFIKDSYPSLLPSMECSTSEDWELVLHSLNKPLSVFGVVRRENGDQGGGPVFATMPNGKTIKICLEMSHVNEADRNKYFGEGGTLPYFNPVLVFFETQTFEGQHTDFNALIDDDFWLLSKRQYLNSQVYYHETVLYELIGNSEKTNLVFVEVPRSLFKPHKYFIDSIGKTRKAYGL